MISPGRGPSRAAPHEGIVPRGPQQLMAEAAGAIGADSGSMGKASAAWALAAAVFASTATGCGPVRSVEAAAANVLISPEQEKQIGDQVQSELESQVRFVNDKDVVRYVNDVAKPVFARAKEQYPKLAVDLRIIDDPKTVNAF